MTYREFLDRLAQTPRDWTLDTYNRLRRDEDTRCPLTAITCANLFWVDAADALGLSRTIADQICAAADNSTLTPFPAVRADLLRACGVVEPDVVCEHGTAMDVHCCHCHSGFVFDADHECPPKSSDGNHNT